jgi:hypothetical protein
VTRALFLLFAWLAVACSLAATSPVVAVVSASGETICSAFAVRGRLVTAAHCVHSDPVSFIRQAPITSGVDYASVVQLNPDQDWAVLQPTIELPELVIGAPSPGPLSVLPARDDWQEAFGTLLESYYAGNAIDGSELRQWSAQLDAEPGWSGSPVLQHGYVVGVLQRCRGAQHPVKTCDRPGYIRFFPASAVAL